ncbi:sugar phosphate isomerase/epimerase family protein [Alienimonas californiensis]|uniref:D-tagatose 3-epimerase n=1 Tax=Alienimonas californiensis TaxID=2527989 RepID=A0A517P921_9PLAN|nr:sugar phosphate isomerase/epimerase family protein [Alienimonas californiensis]QDT15865.1 D-tagatose 3-epimerase [Alienimonas californiensis]
MSFRFAYCNETLAPGRTFLEQCDLIASLGYTGIEVAPFTLADAPTDLSQADRAELKNAAYAAGLEVVGLHWLLAKTTGFHLTTADAGVRAATAERLIELTDLCADLSGSLMVLGSPQQRNLEEGMSLETATDHAAEVLKTVAPRLEERGVTLALEPLAPTETNFLQTCAEAVALAERVGSPRVRLHQDVKAMVGGESEPPATIIHRYPQQTAHFHANDANLLGPGMGDTDFAPILTALKETGYDGWISVEVFADGPGPIETARLSLEHLKAVAAKV